MGPLAGFRIIELAAIGPGPFCGMMLADMGAEVIRIERISIAGQPQSLDILARSRKSIAIDLKTARGVELVLQLVAGADAMYEGFRPGVTERLGLGPEDCMQRNPKLVYGRITGWGQDGPLASAAGHDINYISLAGALHAIGRAGERPVPPLNLVGDFGGGGMLLAFGLVCALLEAQRSGKGQVVDAAMVDGTASLMAMFYSFAASGIFVNKRSSNLLDGGAHFYDTYATSDGKYISIGSIEPQFYALLLEKTGVDKEKFARQLDADKWDDYKAELTEIFKTKTRDEWCVLMEGSDVCFAPVLSMSEAPEHPHNKARETFVNLDGVTHPAPAPRFSRSVPEQPKTAGLVGADSSSLLAREGLSSTEIKDLLATGIVGGE